MRCPERFCNLLHHANLVCACVQSRVEVYDLLEFFAGCGALTDEARCSGYRTASVDIKYVPGGAMDCNAPAGFAFLVTLFLQDVFVGVF